MFKHSNNPNSIEYTSLSDLGPISNEENERSITVWAESTPTLGSKQRRVTSVSRQINRSEPVRRSMSGISGARRVRKDDNDKENTLPLDPSIKLASTKSTSLNNHQRRHSSLKSLSVMNENFEIPSSVLPDLVESKEEGNDNDCKQSFERENLVAAIDYNDIQKYFIDIKLDPFCSISPEDSFCRLLNHLLLTSCTSYSSPNLDQVNVLRQGIRAIFTSSYSTSLFSRFETSFLNSRNITPLTCFNFSSVIGLLPRLVSLLHQSYSIVWLCLGLEVLSNHETSDTLFLDIRQIQDFFELFIIKKFNDPVRQSIFVISKIFALVWTLDLAKQEFFFFNMPLFRKSSSVKSSRDFLRKFSLEFLQGEGDIVRRLKLHLDYSVQHQQTSLDEYNFQISNLRVQIRDGIILTKLIELWTGDESLVSQLKIPALTKSSAISNMVVALSALRDYGIDLSFENKSGKAMLISPADIVNGDREKTLTIFWRCFKKWLLPEIVNDRLLGYEIKKLQIDCQWDELDFPINNSNLSLDFELSALLDRWARGVLTIREKRVVTIIETFNIQLLKLLLHHYGIYTLDTITTVHSDIKEEYHEQSIWDEISNAISLASVFSGTVDPTIKSNAAKIIQSAVRRYQQKEIEDLILFITQMQSLIRGSAVRRKLLQH